MTNEVRVGVLAASAQIMVAVIALVGTLATADPATPSTGTSSPAAATAATPSAPAAPDGARGSECTAVVEQYLALIAHDARTLSMLTTEGPDGTSPLEADPDARRCGLSADALRAMR
jgi:hypothetical protein